MAGNRIGIIGAMEEEIVSIHKDMENSELIEHAGIAFHVGQLFGVPVVLCKSGVGKVNAAVCTQVLIDRFGVSRVLFTGVAGAVDPQLEIGDIVISVDCVQHDVDVRALGFERGVIPFAEASIFAADTALVELASKSSETLFDRKVLKGRILSGDQFVADKALVKELYEQFGGACLEMEGAAVAQVCAMNRVAFVIIRSMSDKADGSAHVNFAEFTKLASERSYQLIAHMVKALR